MPDALALIVVLVCGLYLIGLGVLALLRPQRASKFLLGHAGSAGRHYLELLLRLIVGAAFLRCAPYLPLPDLFAAFGWLLIITTLGLCLIPWRWHQRFAQQAVPRALRHLRLLALVCLLAGVVVLVALAYPAFGPTAGLGTADAEARRVVDARGLRQLPADRAH
jgi:uncharacterized protein YjeT (DUF2065 family)